jgi:hypothetical protein
VVQDIDLCIVHEGWSCQALDRQQDFQGAVPVHRVPCSRYTSPPHGIRWIMDGVYFGLQDGLEWKQLVASLRWGQTCFISTQMDQVGTGKHLCKTKFYFLGASNCGRDNVLIFRRKLLQDMCGSRLFHVSGNKQFH